jgi:hypothetical protein
MRKEKTLNIVPPPNVVGLQGVTTEAITSTANIAFIGRGNVAPSLLCSGKRMRDELLNGGLQGTAGTLTNTGWGYRKLT